MRNKKIKIIGFVSLLIFVLGNFAHNASAQFFPSTPATPTYTQEVPQSPLTFSTAAIAASTASIAAGVGVPGQGVASNIANSVGGAACDSVDSLSSGIDAQSVTSGIPSYSLIGGSSAEVSSLTQRVSTLLTIKICKQRLLDALKNQPILSLIQGQELSRRQQVLSTEINALNQQIESLQSRLSATAKDVLKAISVRLLLTFSQKLTTKLVNSLVAKYKISNYMKYADAVATQIYTKDYIKANNLTNSDQLIVASILNNDQTRNSLLPAVRMQANKNLGFVPGELSVSDPDYFVKMAQVGTAEADPYFLQTMFEGRADTAKASGQASAKNEIDQGKGFIPLRNCAGSVAKQKEIMDRNAKLSTQVESDMQVLQKLQAQFALNPTSAQARQEMEKAAEAVAQSQKALDAMPESVDSPIVEVCEGITNPAAFMADGVQNVLKKHLDESANLRTENLPFWGTFISDVASNLLLNIFQGGKGNAQLLTESGFRASNILSNDLLNGIARPTELSNASLAAENNGAFLAFDDIDASQSQAAGTYTLKWSASDYPNIESVSLSGGVGMLDVTAGAKSSRLSGTTRVQVSSPGTYTYTLNIYVKNKTVPDKVITETLTISEPAALSSGLGPLVHGASVVKEPLNALGERASLTIR